MKLLLLSLIIPANCSCQMSARIDSILWKKGQTIFIRARILKTDSVAYFPVTFKGIGRKPDLIGLKGTYHQHGIGRRKVYFTINQP